MNLEGRITLRRVTEVKDGDICGAYTRERNRKIIFIAVMCAIAAVALIYTVSVGNYRTTLPSALEAIVNHIMGNEINPDDEFYIWNMYLPRALAGVVVGAGLAIGGVVMQNILRNPLAEPYTMGVSSGAMFGATLSIGLGISIVPFLSGYTATVVNAFIMSLVPAMIIMLIAFVKKVTPVMMILTGIAVMYLFGSINSLIMATTTSETMQDIYYWNIGSLSRAGWEHLPLMAAATVVLGIALYALSKKLDVMYSGDRSAQSLGIKVHKLRIVALILASLLTAALVSCTGTIGFVGLVAPHVARIFVGSNNKFLMPAAAAFGVAFLLVADTIAKSIGAGNLPVGVISSLVGGPLFIYLLVKMRKYTWM